MVQEKWTQYITEFSLLCLNLEVLCHSFSSVPDLGKEQCIIYSPWSRSKWTDCSHNQSQFSPKSVPRTLWELSPIEFFAVLSWVFHPEAPTAPSLCLRFVLLLDFLSQYKRMSRAPNSFLHHLLQRFSACSSHLFTSGEK